MKQVFVPLKSLMIKLIVLAFLFFYLQGLKAQTYPELVFQNVTLESGTAGANGAKYRFSNIANNVDAVIEIKGRSGSNVILNNIDVTGYGWNKAFQPELGIVGTPPPNANWWMEFRMTFYKAGTNEKKKINKFVVTGLDIDGDGVSVKEWVEMKKIKTVTVSSVNLLATNLLASILDLLDDNNCGDDVKIVGPITNFTNIDTGGTAVMATYEYEKKDQIEFKIGGQKSNSNANAAAMRLNSFWFKEFDLTPQPITLPVKLLDFSAKLQNSKVSLAWTTAQEKAFSHFAVERSSDGRNFTDVGVIFTMGNSETRKEYSLVDAGIASRKGLLYYRLRMVDLDQEVTYSATRIIKLDEAGKQLTITTYPNPVITELRVTLPSVWQGKEVHFEILNSNGQAMIMNKTPNASQTETISLAGLKKGIYFLRAVCGDESAQQRIIKN